MYESEGGESAQYYKSPPTFSIRVLLSPVSGLAGATVRHTFEGRHVEQE